MNYRLDRTAYAHVVCLRYARVSRLRHVTPRTRPATPALALSIAAYLGTLSAMCRWRRGTRREVANWGMVNRALPWLPDAESIETAGRC